MKYNYPFTYRQAIKCIIYCIVFLILFTMQQTSSNFNRVYFQFYGYIFLIGIFVYKYFLFQRKVKEKIYISVNATKCLKMFGNLIVYLAGIVFIGILIIIKDRRAWDEYLLMWQFGLLFILYLIAIFYPFIVVFGEKSYISGSFGMCYGEIREIVDVKTYDIMGTEIKKCEVVTKLALEGINLKIEKGQKIAFVGESGSGKTTLSAKIKEGQEVKFEIAAYPSSEYGYFEGTVENIAKDVSVDQSTGHPYYLVEVMCGSMALKGKDGEEAALMNGMACQAKIVVGEKNVLA